MTLVLSQLLLLSSKAPVLSKEKDEARVLVQGLGDGYIPVPLRKVYVESELVTGMVTVGVVPSLPVGGVHLLLGNVLAGSRVSVDPVVVDTPVTVNEMEALEGEFPGIFPDCVVTRSRAKS